MEKLDDFRANALENSTAAQNRQEKYYNAKHRDISYEIGDIVWAKNRILSAVAQAIAAKLSPKYAGPFIVKARLGMNLYQLENEDGIDVGKVAVCDLKPCFDEERFLGDGQDAEDTEAESKTETPWLPKTLVPPASPKAQSQSTSKISDNQIISIAPQLPETKK